MNIVDEILKNVQYSGEKEANKKIISASSIDDDFLRIFYRYKYGVPKSEKIGQDSLGSILHLGLEKIFENKDDFEAELSLEKEIKNGWKLSGTIDLYDKKNNVIYDYKLTKQYTYKKLLEAIRSLQNHQYIWQLNVYRYLMGTNSRMKILMFLKDGGYDFRKMEDIPSVMEIEIPYIDDKKIEAKIESIANSLEDYIEKNTEPEQCKDVWLRKTKEGIVPVRCMKYCAYKDVCKYYRIDYRKEMLNW